MDKFTPEQVREHLKSYTRDWPCAHGEILCDFLRSKGLLEENKPLLFSDLPLRRDMVGEFYYVNRGKADAHQAALDKVRDMLRPKYSAHNMDACTCRECAALRVGIREGLWLAPEAP